MAHENPAIPEKSEDPRYPTPLASPRPADVRSDWSMHRAAGRGDLLGDLRLRASREPALCLCASVVDPSYSGIVNATFANPSVVPTRMSALATYFPGGSESFSRSAMSVRGLSGMEIFFSR